MSIQKRVQKIGSILAQQRLRVITVLLFMAMGTYLLTQSQAAAGYIYISPSTGNRYVGETFSVQVRISTTSPINAAFVDINYNGIGLQVTSIQRGSGFPTENSPTQHTPSSTGTGRIKMQSVRSNSVTGDLHYATITFKATKTGTYGVSPIGSSHLINYPSNEVSYTFGRGDYTFATAPSPPPPPPPSSPPPSSPPPPPPSPPKPPSKPQPRPSSSKPAPTTKPTATVPKTESKPSASGFKIYDFAVTDLTYRSAVITWKTNRPATSKVNYGFSSDNMPDEIIGKGKTTSHKLLLVGDNIRAGNQYAIRITSDDGKGPLWLDAEFATKGISIIVKVTDSLNQPVSGALVQSETLEATTGDEGTVELIAPEGSVAINATKDDLSGNVIAEISLPESEDSLPQQVAITLNPQSDTSASPPAESGQSNVWLIILPMLLGGIGFMGLVLFVRRKRMKAARNTPHVTIETDFGRGEQPAHYPTLPELVQQDLSAKRKKPAQLEEEPEDMYAAAKHSRIYESQPTSQPAKHHTSAPEQKPPAVPPPIHHAQKTSHVQPSHEETSEDKPKQHAPEHKPSHPKPHRPEAEIDPKDHSIHINHDD